MRLSPHLSNFLPSFFLLPTFASAFNNVCEPVIKGKPFDLKALSGPYSVVETLLTPPTITKTTFTIDLCKPLRKLKGVPKDEDCPVGSRVCGIKRLYSTIETGNVNGTIESAIGIAGEFLSTGEPLDPKWERLKLSASPGDREKEGLRLQMNGAKYPPGKTAKKQKAVIEFLCDAKPEKKQDRRRGTSGLSTTSKDDDDDGEDVEDPEAGDVTEDGQGGRLKYLSYEDVGGTMILSLEWTTKYACEDAKQEPAPSSGHWGFFTWLIIIVFLATAAYLIFHSWLNYTRNSARGWDLLPHSESIRDIPYLLRDWTRRVVNTVQGGGGGSRGGYSAV